MSCGLVVCSLVVGPVVPAPASAASGRAGGAAPDPVLFAYDRTVPLGVRTTPVTSAVASARVDLLEYTTFDGTRVPGMLVRPVPVPRRGPCLLLQHGLTGSKESIVEAFPELVEAGYTVLAIDAREHGARDGFTGGNPAHDIVRLERMLRESVIDLRRAVDVLRTRSECSPARIGYVGVSMGAMMGALLGGVDRRVRLSALLLGGGDWQAHFESGADVFLPDVVADPGGLLSAHAALDPLDPAAWVGRISPRPLLIVAGTKDRTIVPAMAAALIEASREPRTVVWTETGHVVLGPGAATLHRALRSFLGRSLPVRGERSSASRSSASRSPASRSPASRSPASRSPASR